MIELMFIMTLTDTEEFAMELGQNSQRNKVTTREKTLEGEEGAAVG